MVTVEYEKPTELKRYSASDFEKELLKIPDEEVRMWTKTALENAPDSFWGDPASKSGRYHPIDECAWGGRVIHTKRAFCVMEILVDSERDKLGDCIGSFCLSAILLHDVCSGHTHPEDVYPYYRDKLGQEFVDKYPIIMNMVKSHMGRWGKQRPRTLEECLVHYADNVASKLHLMRPEVPYDTRGCKP